MRNIFFIHIMKTAGTSFRFILEKTLANRLYPTTDELGRNNNGWYLDNHQLLAALNNTTLDITHRTVVCGHHPYIMGFRIFDHPIFAAFIRDPLSRTVSVIGHRRHLSPQFQGLGIREMLSITPFVENQIENYQTKIFAIESLDLASVNAPYRIDRAGFERAKARVRSLDFIGLTEAFDSSVSLFAKKTGIEAAEPSPRLNVGDEIQLSDEEAELIKPFVTYDIELYEIAQERFYADLRNG